MIYLDNAATSFPKPPEVINAVTAALLAPASPGRSGHAPALEASRRIHKARKALATLFGLNDNSRLVFTPNITWAINLAINCFKLSPGDHVVSSGLEHNSTARPLARLSAENGLVWDVVEQNDKEDLPKAFKNKLGPKTKLAVLCHASNVSGALAPAEEIKKALGGVPLILDTAQTAGAMDLSDVGRWVDILTFTGHKGLLGPTGTGGLWLRPGIEPKALAVGGSGSRSESLDHPDFLPDALEAGTGNTHGLAGLAAGVEFVLEKGPENIRNHELSLTQVFLEGLKGLPGVKVYGPGPGITERVATVSLNLSGWSSSDLALQLEKNHCIMTRAGLHCAPLAHQQLGSYPGGSVRFSFGVFNTENEIQIAVKALSELAYLRH